MRALVLAVAVVAAGVGAAGGCHKKPAAGAVDADQKACDAGDDKACERFTLTLLHGSRDAEAAALNQRLCDGGRRYFCPTYAFILAEGRGVPRDRAHARALFEASCQYDPNGCSEYGNLYATGNGVARDLELGHFLLDLACKNHDEQACKELGLFTRPPR